MRPRALAAALQPPAAPPITRARRRFTRAGAVSATCPLVPRYTIFVPHPSNFLTDHRPYGDGLLAWGFLERLADRGHRLHVACQRVDVAAPPRDDLRLYPLTDAPKLGGRRRIRYMGRVRRLYAAIAERERIDLVHQLNPVDVGLSLALPRSAAPVVLGPYVPDWPGGSSRLRRRRGRRMRARPGVGRAPRRRAAAAAAPRRARPALLRGRPDEGGARPARRPRGDRAARDRGRAVRAGRDRAQRRRRRSAAHGPLPRQRPGPQGRLHPRGRVRDGVGRAARGAARRRRRRDGRRRAAPAGRGLTGRGPRRAARHRRPRGDRRDARRGPTSTACRRSASRSASARSRPWRPGCRSSPRAPAASPTSCRPPAACRSRPATPARSPPPC